MTTAFNTQRARSDLIGARTTSPVLVSPHKSRIVAGHLFLAGAMFVAAMWTPALAAQETLPLSMSAHEGADVAQLLVNFVTTINRDEIAAGQLAMARATRPDVRAFAAQVVETHKSAMTAWARQVPAFSLTIPDSSAPPMTAKAMAKSSAASDGVSEVRDTTSGLRGGTTAAAIHSANIASLDDLKAANGARFDSLYLAGRIEGYDAVLKELAKQPPTYDGLQSLLTQFRKDVQDHHTEARKLLP